MRPRIVANLNRGRQPSFRGLIGIKHPTLIHQEQGEWSKTELPGVRQEFVYVYPPSDEMFIDVCRCTVPNGNSLFKRSRNLFRCYTSRIEGNKTNFRVIVYWYARPL